MNICSKFPPYRTMGKCESVQNLGEMFGGKTFGTFGKKKCKHQNCHPKTNLHIKSYLNQTMGKCSNPRGGGEWGAERIRKIKRYKWHSKMNLYCEFHQNWTMGKCSNLEGKVWGGRNLEKEKM